MEFQTLFSFLLTDETHDTLETSRDTNQKDLLSRSPNSIQQAGQVIIILILVNHN